MCVITCLWMNQSFYFLFLHEKFCMSEFEFIFRKSGTFRNQKGAQTGQTIHLV